MTTRSPDQQQKYQKLSTHARTVSVPAYNYQFTPSASATVPAYTPLAKNHTRNRTVPEPEPEPYQKL